jgi:hypothetical protein
MHENRETSETPVGHEASRPAGEGDSHTARVYVAEESDSGIVPMNHSNQDGKPLAESEEGRPLLKENTPQSRTHPTQRGARVSQRLVGVRPAEHRLAAMHPREEPYGAVKLVDVLAGESPASANYPVGTVVISGDGAGDQTVGSPEVNALDGWM